MGAALNLNLGKGEMKEEWPARTVNDMSDEIEGVV